MIAMFNMYSYSLFTLLPEISDKYCQENHLCDDLAQLMTACAEELST